MFQASFLPASNSKRSGSKGNGRPSSKLIRVPVVGPSFDAPEDRLVAMMKAGWGRKEVGSPIDRERNSLSINTPKSGSIRCLNESKFLLEILVPGRGLISCNSAMSISNG